MRNLEIVPVSPTDALRLSAGFTARDIALLAWVEQLGTVTTEQLARAFFNSPRSAYNRLRLLSEHRFLARVPVDPMTIRFATGTAGIVGIAGIAGTRGYEGGRRRIAEIGIRSWNPAFSLDWNGYYLLTVHHRLRARNWRASTAGTAGAVTSRLGHVIGVSDIWSYAVAAARATQELDLGGECEDKWRYRLKTGFLTERQAMLTAKQAAAAYSASNVANASNAAQDVEDNTRGRSAALLRPDGALILVIRELDLADGDNPTPVRVSHSPVSALDEPGSSVPAVDNVGNVGNVGKARWDPSLHSWQQALLSTLPPRSVMTAPERPGGTIYRSLLLEMETGSNHGAALKEKVTRYNQLVRNRKQAWDRVYGHSPRVLVVVRTDDQIEMQAQIWRSHYIVQAETAVLLTSLRTLSRVYNSTGTGIGAAKRGRRELLEQPCWLDVMAASGPAWKTLSAALHIGSEA